VSSEVTAYAEEVLSRFSKQITDEVFLSIQSDRDLMREYLRLVERNGVETVNRWIGRRVKERFNLEKDTARQDSPKSTLIQSHQEFV